MSRFVAILMGSSSDQAVMDRCCSALKELGVGYEVRILSAHRTPLAAAEYVQDATTRGAGVFVAAAGLAAHLAGAVAANTIRPVLGVPMDAGSLGGIDALLSTVQMPGGTPVACMAIGGAGAVNAAYFAAEILAVEDKELASVLLAKRAEKREQIMAADKKLQASHA
jgi:5-(carboxyamino)imidazole ribonucleotide mutase